MNAKEKKTQKHYNNQIPMNHYVLVHDIYKLQKKKLHSE